MKHQSQLSFGVMVNSMMLQSWQRDCINKLIESNIANFNLLIINDVNFEPEPFFRKFYNWMINDFIYHFYLKFFCKANSRKNVDCTDLLKDIRQIKCKTIRKGKFSEYFSQESISIIKNNQLDFILRFGFNIIRGDILNSAKYGVWSFHHGDEQTYRGGPTGFWEIYNGERINGAILQRLTNTIDAGIILKKGYFPVVAHSYHSHIDQLLNSSTIWPLSVCKDILSGNAHYFNSEPASTKAKINRIPGNLKMLIFIVKFVQKRVDYHFRDLFFEEQWNIGICRSTIEQVLKHPIENKNIVWMPLKKRSHFNADPFIIPKQEKVAIIYESFDYRTNKGVLVRTDFEKEKGFHNSKVILEEQYHLSYPSVFQDNGISYCIPEQCDNEKVALYRIHLEDFSLHYFKDLVTGIRAVDPTVFEYGGLFWLFFTKQDDDSNTNLYAYYAESITDEFKPHNNNPVKTDIASARPAGNVFTIGNHTYRPSQDSSIRYGGSLKINEIIELTPDIFVENEIRHIKPGNKSRYPDGLHTINMAGIYMVIDAKRLCFIWPSFINKFKKKALNILS